ncbi:aminoglycoside adenylyltransferase [Micromonospora sp. NPDC049301]|uniref:nucleotidyltransferase domain-containing protein n=1 Tax=Micromonospora sp. NPDC049301 TaxID=3155723 RepID=UPI00343CF714
MAVGLNERQLEAIAETLDLAQQLGVEVWLRGGWAMDFFLGEITREHVDVDWFAWSHEAARLAAALTDHGYALLADPPHDQQLDLVRADVELSFALLARDKHGRVVVAGGPWADEPWPDGMLDGGLGRLGGLRCPIIEPRAQIEIKQMMPVWVPGRPRRAKDAADIARLAAALVCTD